MYAGHSGGVNRGDWPRCLGTANTAVYAYWVDGNTEELAYGTEFREYDEHGFPLPPRFEHIQAQDDAPVRRPKINLRAKRLVLIVLVLGLIVPAIFGPQIVSAGRELVSRWFTTRAERKSLAGDLPGALKELSRAIYWNPDDLELRYLCAVWRTEMNDLSGSLADWNDLISQYKDPEHLPPQRNAWLFDQADVYSGRAWVFVRLGAAGKPSTMPRRR